MENMSNNEHWKKATNPDYLGSFNFKIKGKDSAGLYEYESIADKITGVEFREIFNQKTNKKEDCRVILLEKNKPLILNKINSKMLEKITGSPIPNDWKGTVIGLNCSYYKGLKEYGVVILERAPKAALKYNCDDCGAEIKPIKTKDGEVITPEEYAVRSKNKSGKIICTSCFAKQSQNTNTNTNKE